MRIVVVEDEAPIREGMAKLLSKINPEYSDAQNGWDCHDEEIAGGKYKM